MARKQIIREEERLGLKAALPWPSENKWWLAEHENVPANNQSVARWAGNRE
jgi:hypothetical protein